MTDDLGRYSKNRRRWATVLALLAAACAAPLPPTPTPLPSGQARLWFYRTWEPAGSPNVANVDVNGSYIGTVENGGAFYRDLAPGHYHIAPVSYNHDVNQDRDVDIGAGQQAYIKILASQSWDGACRDCVRDTFYAWLIPPEVAQTEIAGTRRGG